MKTLHSRFRLSLLLLALGAATLAPCAARAATPATPWSQRVANAAIARWPQGRVTDPSKPWNWNYELGTLLDGMDATWYNTADGRYFYYIQHSVDHFVKPDGSIATYDPRANELDSILLGRQLLLLYRVTQQKRYYIAATHLRAQLAAQPTDASGGFWHKKIYPNQMWLDGLYMAEPFYAEYASVFHQPQDFPIITRQFVLVEQHARDPKTGLLYHGWDESKKASWANPATGDSASFWARGMGWYMMALVDTLPYYPAHAPGRAQLLDILNRTARAVIHYQDPSSGLWYQVLNKPHAPGNYFESSASCMFTYAIAKGVRLGYLPARDEAAAQRAWRGIQQHFLKTSADGTITLTNTVQAIGLGGPHHHDGSYHYYVSSPVVSNDPKGIGAFLLAANEMELGHDPLMGRGQTAVVDGWFNSQRQTNAAGVSKLYHYKWTDYANPGFSLFGHIFHTFGVATRTLPDAPTAANLKGVQYYLIVSPDNLHWNPHPHYMTAQDADRVAAWVHRGGTLLMLENDSPNADITHFDILADKFGLHFNNVLIHHVVGRDFAMGSIDISHPTLPFTHPHVIYMKDTCSLRLSGNAVAHLRYKGAIYMASARYGKGLVYAVTDPWLYNEYTDGRKPNFPYSAGNYTAGREWVRWLIQQRARRPH